MKTIALIGTDEDEFKSFMQSSLQSVKGHYKGYFMPNASFMPDGPINEIRFLPSATKMYIPERNTIISELKKKLVIDYEDVLSGPIYSLSIKQPFASLFFHKEAPKTLEVRSQPTNIRGPILICSSKEPYKFKELIKTAGYRQAFDIKAALELYSLEKKEIEKDLPCGEAIGIAYLLHSRRMNREDQKGAYLDFNSDIYINGKIVWEFLWSRPIKPFAVTGNLGFRLIDESTKKLIEFL